MPNPFLDRKRQEEEDPYLQAQGNPYPETAPAIAPRLGPSAPQALNLASDLDSPQVRALDPEERPMVAGEDTPAWEKALRLLPGAVVGAMHLGGSGTQETRGMGLRMVEQAAAQNDADTRRAAHSKARAIAYNNKIQQRKQALQRLKAQDAIAAEDRGRRIEQEDLAAGIAAQDRDPQSPKNQAFQKALATTYPEVWNQLTPEQQAGMTVGQGAALRLSLEEAAAQRESERKMREERSKQKAEFDFATPGGGVGGSDYLAWLAATRGGGTAPPTVGPGAPAPPPQDDPLIQDLSDLYGGKDKIPPGMLARARGVLTGSRAGLGTKEMAMAHQRLLEEAAQDQKETATRERQARLDEQAAKKAEAQQDAQYAQQRNMRNIDQVRSKLVQLKKAIAPYLDENGNLKANIPGSGATGNLAEPLQLALTPKGKQIMRLKKELLDTRVREATGANAPEGEVKEFKKMGGVGTWDTDEDMVMGLKNAEAILDQQEAYLDANYLDASIRFHQRIKEREEKEAAKKAPDPTKLEGYEPPPKGGR